MLRKFHCNEGCRGTGVRPGAACPETREKHSTYIGCRERDAAHAPALGPATGTTAFAADRGPHIHAATVPRLHQVMPCMKAQPASKITNPTWLHFSFALRGAPNRI